MLEEGPGNTCGTGGGTPTGSGGRPGTVTGADAGLRAEAARDADVAGGAGPGPGAGPAWLADLERAARAACAADTSLMTGAACADIEPRVFLLSQRLEAIRLRALAQVDASGQWQETGCESTAAWLKSTRNINHGRAKADVSAARVTALAPAMAAALADGDITRAHLDAAARVALATDERKASLPGFDQVLTGAARQCTPSQFARVLDCWADQLQPETTAQRERAAHHRRFLCLSPLGDGWDLRGFLGNEQGAALAAALNAEMQREFRRSGATDPDGTDGGPTGCPAGPRTGPEPGPRRRADALVRIAQLAAAAGDMPETGGLRPTVCVTMPAGVVAGTAPVPASGPGHRLPFLGASASIDVPNGTGEALISRHSAMRLACDSHIHRALIDSDGLPLDIGRTTRTVPAWIRKALALRDRGCAHPGCDKPPGWCEAHHIQHWADGGTTSLDNLLMLCDQHHRAIHDRHARTEIDARPRKPRVVRRS